MKAILQKLLSFIIDNLPRRKFTRFNGLEENLKVMNILYNMSINKEVNSIKRTFKK